MTRALSIAIEDPHVQPFRCLLRAGLRFSTLQG
jgi:hypothetical protein